LTSSSHKPSARAKKWLWAAGAVVLAILAWAIFGRGGGKHEGEAVPAAAISVQTVTIGKSALPDEVTASGTVRPVTESTIAPKIMSNVAAILVREGDRVRAGQVLVRLESRDLRAQLAQAEAALSAAIAGAGRARTAIELQTAQTSTGIATAEAALKAAREQLSLVRAGPRSQQRAQARLGVVQAEAQLKNAETELDRMKRLQAQDVVPRQRLDAAQTAYDVAKAQFEAAQEQASLTEEGSRQQEIRAAEQQVRQAEEALRLARASAAQDKMSVSNARVAESQVKQARAAVELSRTQLSYATITSPMSGVVSRRMVDPGDTVSPGVPVIAVQADSKFRLEADVPASSAALIRPGRKVQVRIGAAGRAGEGTVAVVSPAGDPSSRKFVVKVELPDDLGARSGEFGRISFPAGYSSGFILPEEALRDTGGLPTVFIVDGEDRARMRNVKIGRRAGDGIEILSGLEPDDRVIVENTGVLDDGVPVRAEDR